MTVYFQSLTRDRLADFLKPFSKNEKQAHYRARQIFQWVYARLVTDWDQMTDLAKNLRVELKEKLPFYEIEKTKELTAEDGTKKLLWRLQDSKTIESVIIPFFDEDKADRMTACISSQVGCALKCEFCLTGTQGFERNLETHEIIAQVFGLKKIAPLTNIVFMGMGEPLLNFDAVTDACAILTDGMGFNFSKRKVTISTAGIIPALKKLPEKTDVCLAISLNATTDDLRSKLMPINKKYGLKALLKVCKEFPVAASRRITFEYVLISGMNDSPEDARRLAGLLKGIKAKVNLIAYNENPESDFRRPAESKVREFQKILLSLDVPAMLRASRGQEILAACGQLKSKESTG